MSLRATLRRAGGLRLRLAAAMALCALAAIAAVLLAVVPRLEGRLVDDRLADLRGLARTARPELRELPRRDLRPGSERLRRIADGLAGRVGGRIAIDDAAGVVLADSARRAGAPILGLAAERARAARDTTHVVSGRQGDRAFAVAGMHADGEEITLVIVKRLADTRAAVATVRAGLPLAVGAALVVALVVALALSGRLLRRLRRLQADARALGTEGLRHPVVVRGHDEVSEVAAALEAMRARLVEEETSRQAFVATASHELRTPLASLQATLELLREEVGDGDADVLTARADAALRQAARLGGLATDLLDLSRVDGDAPLRPEPLEVAEVAGLVAREFTGRLGRDGRPLRVVGGGPAVAVADPAAVARIVRVLLDNACAHGAGAVRLETRDEADAIRLEVCDEGAGIGAGDAERVFVRFARGADADGAPGFGLGLPIARGLARAMDGTLELAPPDTGGARFVVRLPRWQG
jgi:signal transduction histidine kinase